MTWSVVLTASNRPDAEVVAAILRGNGIDAFIAADDAGTTAPNLAFAIGVEVRVRAEDVTLAREILGRGAGPPSAEQT